MNFEWRPDVDFKDDIVLDLYADGERVRQYWIAHWTTYKGQWRCDAGDAWTTLPTKAEAQAWVEALWTLKGGKFK